jgi:hypothetical protein
MLNTAGTPLPRHNEHSSVTHPAEQDSFVIGTKYRVPTAILAKKRGLFQDLHGQSADHFCNPATIKII